MLRKASNREQTPVITPVSEAGDGFDKGDLMATLDESLAKRIEEIMRLSGACEDGRAFDNQPSRRKHGGGYRRALCAAESVVANTQPGGPLSDIMLMDPKKHAFGFRESVGDVFRGANVLVNFVLSYRAMLSIERDKAVQVANYLFALGIIIYDEDQGLRERNRIKASLVTTGAPPEPTQSGCPNAEENDVGYFLTSKLPLHVEYY